MDQQQKLDMLGQLQRTAERVYSEALERGVILIGAPPTEIAVQARHCWQEGCESAEIQTVLKTAQTNAQNAHRARKGMGS